MAQLGVVGPSAAASGRHRTLVAARAPQWRERRRSDTARARTPHAARRTPLDTRRVAPHNHPGHHQPHDPDPEGTHHSMTATLEAPPFTITNAAFSAAISD
ncbi:MAG: hypothetical protein QM692_22065, partial [Thermomicrobiales bacterium]